MAADEAADAAPVPQPTPRRRRRLTLARFRKLEAALRTDGYDDMIAWSEAIAPPANTRAFAREVIYVICNSGMRVATANRIYWKCRRALNRGHSSATVFGHRGKAAAIDHVWQHRRILFAAWQIAENKLAYCETLPFVGPVTRHHLAKNLGVNTVKPDVHLARLARAEGVTAWDLCHRLARQTGYRETTIDTILWRACADELLNSSLYLAEGWDAAFNPNPLPVRLSEIEQEPADELAGPIDDTDQERQGSSASARQRSSTAMSKVGNEVGNTGATEEKTE